MFFSLLGVANHANLYKNLIKIQMFNVNLRTIDGPDPSPLCGRGHLKSQNRCTSMLSKFGAMGVDYSASRLVHSMTDLTGFRSDGIHAANEHAHDLIRSISVLQV